MRGATGRLWFDFPGSSEPGGFVVVAGPAIDRDGDIDEDLRRHEEIAEDRMGAMHDTFSDLSLYVSLLREPGCVDVELSSVLVRHDPYGHGIQSIYKLTYSDGTTRLRTGSRNEFSTGYYGRRTPRATGFHLEDDERITGIRVNRGDVLDGITFVTNLREEHCGGIGGGGGSSSSSLKSSLAVDLPPMTRLVAFCGTVSDVSERIGIYARDVRWELCLGVFVLTRELARSGRADVVVARRSEDDDDDDDDGPRSQNQSLSVVLDRMNALDDGVFRYIMKFLA